METLPPFNPAWWRLAWAGVFLANLVVPLSIGWTCTQDHGRVGMFLAIVPFWLLGHYCCGKSLQLSIIYLAGGVIVGLLQLFPVLHLMAGAIALTITRLLGQLSGSGDFGDHIDSELGGFLATTLTGWMLISCALGLGGLFHAVSSGWKNRSESVSEKPKPGLFDPEIDG